MRKLCERVDESVLVKSSVDQKQVSKTFPSVYLTHLCRMCDIFVVVKSMSSTRMMIL